ncbi:MAG: tyrosine-type recombinase/integrase [Clostridium celatum]|uniref:tyrosine-type recombinase/integrase n=1 Tax=Clostridium tertium TaxID=1559 RepID=UPI0029049886|nr:tyrosine-type recombinase/integrase [Clostridium celatum]
MANYKADMEAKLVQEKDKLISNVPDFLYTYIEDYLPSQSNELRSHIAYAKDIINFLKYYSMQLSKEINEVTLDDMNNVTIRLLNNYFKYITQYTITYTTHKGKEVTKIRTNSTTSKARKLAVLKKFYKYLVKSNLVNNNPTEDMRIDKPDVSKIDNRLDNTEVNDLAQEIINGNNISSTLEKKAQNRLFLRDITIFTILSHTGIRVSELVSLDIADVDVKKCTIRVIRKNNKIEEIPYPSKVSDIIEDYLNYRNSINSRVKDEYKKALFVSQKNTRISTESVKILIKKYGYRINMDIPGCHTLRRTFLSSLYNKTGDIRLTARIGGHSVATASKYYADVDNERLRDTMREFSYN